MPHHTRKNMQKKKNRKRRKNTQKAQKHATVAKITRKNHTQKDVPMALKMPPCWILCKAHTRIHSQRPPGTFVAESIWTHVCHMLAAHINKYITKTPLNRGTEATPLFRLSHAANVSTPLTPLSGSLSHKKIRIKERGL